MAHAVLLHPLVAYSGNQHNHVIAALNERLLRTDITPHRFDFSSAAQSAAQEETLAQIEACDGPVVLIGYSFGGGVAATITHPAVIGWALIAPALVSSQFVSPATPFQPPPTLQIADDPRPKLVVLAENDAWFGADVIDPLIADWTACERQTVPSADHFFAATTDDVAERVVRWAVAAASSPAAS